MDGAHMKILKKYALVSCALATSLLVSAAAEAMTFNCATLAMGRNKWICTENTDLCQFIFYADATKKTMRRKGPDDGPDIKIVVDKWNDKIIIAHEDRTRIDSLFIEQYWYKIELETGTFLMANEYMTNSGRYLTQQDLDAVDKKRFSYYRPKLLSEPGSCKTKM
jgi:hypothetical protein